MKVKVRAVDDALIDASCVLCLPLDEGQGNVAYDKSGKANNGTIYEAVWVDGKYGKALNFDGVDDYVEVPNFRFSQNFTVALWVKAYPKYTVHNSFEILVGHPSDWNGTMSLTLEDTFFGIFRIFDVQNNEYLLVADNLYDENAWTFIALSYDGSKMKIYKNGVNVASKDVSVTLRTPANNLRIALPGGGSQHNTMICDEVRIYNRALNQNEIQRIMNSTYHAKFFLPYRLKVKV